MTTDTTTTEKPVVRRPDRKRPDGTGRAGKRSFDIEDDLWFAARDAAHARGVSLSSILRDRCEELVAEGKAEV